MQVRRLAPYSRPTTLRTLDGRTRAAKLIEAARADLTAHVGGAPSSIESRLIERAAVLTAHVAVLDAKALEAGGMTDHDSRVYLAFSNTLTRTLKTLGLKGAPADRAPSLAQIIARHQAEAQP